MKIHTSFPKGIPFLAVCLAVLLVSACGSREIRELQANTQQTEQALNSLERAQQTQYREIQLTQTNLQQVLQDLSDRLSDVEATLQRVQQRQTRMEDFTSSSATMTQELSRSKQELESQVDQQLATLAGQVQSLAQEISNLSNASQSRYTDSIQRTRDAQVELDQRITAIENNNRALFERILNELGAAPPADVQATSSTVGETVDYTVAPGDTLSKIAEQFRVPVRAIQDINGISNPSLIRVGQTIQIPK